MTPYSSCATLALATLAVGTFACQPSACPDVAIGEAESGLTAPARYVVGQGAPWPVESRRGDEAALRTSLAARRTLGWHVVSRLVEDVAVASPTGGEVALPRFQTWYDAEDLRRVIQYLDQSATTPGEFSAAELEEAFAWNSRAVLEFEGWPAERLAAFVEATRDGEGARGLGGIERVVFSPAAARHLVQSHREISECTPPSPQMEVPEEFRVQERAESVWLDGCGGQRLGPYSVADGGTFVATSDDAVSLRVDGEECEGECRVSGPADVVLEVRAIERGRAEVQVRYDEPVALWTPCLAGEFPDGSTIIKTEYRRVGFDVSVGAHDTSPVGIESVFSDGETWTEGEPRDPREDSIFTLTLPGGARYRLTAMHAMTKELNHWVWSTMWWSDTPGEDFGEDRPASLGAPWNQYKMCATTWFEEEDRAFDGVSDEIRDASSLRGTESWCSNPFIESGEGVAATNCIGCHQHAGVGVSSEGILAGEVVPGDRPGRFQERNNFPTDYVFSAGVIAEIVRALPTR